MLSPQGLHALTRKEALERGRMSVVQHVLVLLSSLAVAASGAALLWIRYGLPLDEDSFSIYRHPTEPWWLVLHVLAAPVFLFEMGDIFLHHAKRHWRARLHRGSGGLLFALIALMTYTGYLLYFVGDERWHNAIKLLHIATGLLFASVLGWHVVAGRLAKLRAR